MTFQDEEEAIFNEISRILVDELGLETVSSFSKEPILSFPGLTILLHRREALLDNVKVPLTQLEFRTLYYLAQHPERVFTKEQIYREMYQEAPIGEIANLY